MDQQLDTESRPPTERVRAGRGLPVLVALAVVGSLAVFVARPWDDHSPQPSPSLVAQAGATPGLALPATSPSAAPAPTLTAPPPVLPTPDLGTQAPPGSVTLSAVRGASTVRCSYGHVRRGTRRLVAIEVAPPVVTLNPDAQATDISRVGWRFQLEMNEQQSVFSANWLKVGSSRTQAIGTAQGRPAAFTPITLTTRPSEATDSTVYRVRVIVEWYTRNLEPAGRADIVASHYQPARASADEPSWPYCAGVLRSS